MKELKTLILNGSPKRNGDTSVLVDALAKSVMGDVKILTCLDNVLPCNDCRYCWKNPGCAIEDGMQTVYSYLNECDNVVLASPIWFSSLSGPLLNMASRMQTLYAGRHFRHERREVGEKNGVLILTGAERGTEETPARIAKTIMRHMNVKLPCVATVYSLDTNNIPAAEDKTALDAIRQAAFLLNGLCQGNSGC